ncbi:hypothetical protein HDU76_001481 [Blyttiomyces sp. JEL0837]|nr:hypothetical protein HDU76_001481 [Blyttiomyces sp. JEL0837]
MIIVAALNAICGTLIAMALAQNSSLMAFFNRHFSSYGSFDPLLLSFTINILILLNNTPTYHSRYRSPMIIVAGLNAVCGVFIAMALSENSSLMAFFNRHLSSYESVMRKKAVEPLGKKDTAEALRHIARRTILFSFIPLLCQVPNAITDTISFKDDETLSQLVTKKGKTSNSSQQRMAFLETGTDTESQS